MNMHPEIPYKCTSYKLVYKLTNIHDVVCLCVVKEPVIEESQLRVGRCNW